MIRFYLLLTFSIVISLSLNAQVITCTPEFPTDLDSVTVIFDASQGSAGLKGYTGDVYAHTGVITDASTSGSDWKHAPSKWGDNSAKYKLTRVDANLYQFKIGPTVHEYYGLSAAEKVKKLAFVFRNTDGSKTGKEKGDVDIFYNVYSANLNVNISKPIIKPVIAKLGDTVIINASANYSDSLALYINNVFYSGVKGKQLVDTIKIDSELKTWIKVTAIKGIEAVSDSFYYFVQAITPVLAVPAGLHDGINYHGDTAITFVLFAPKKKSVFIIGDFNNWMPDNSYLMNRDGDRYWLTINKLQKGKEYVFQYLIDGELRIADPYSEKISDPMNDKSIPASVYPNLISYPEGKTSEIAGVVQPGQESYPWKEFAFNPPAKEKLVIYELLIRDFTSNRDIKTVTDTLQYLKRLGINAIELMPFSEFEGNDSWGYNPSFYFAPDKAYGTKNDFKKFIETCHENGIAVIQDMVLNHSYGQSPLVRMYFEGSAPSADNPWYNLASPNTAYSWGYDFNHESVYTQKFIDSVASFWLSEYKVDGFRYDFTKGFTNKPGDGGAYDASRIAILKRMANEVWKRNSKAYVILEHFADNSEEKELANAGLMIWGNHNWAYAQSAMGYTSESDFSNISYKKRGWDNANLVGYMESHDEERVGYKCLTWGTSADAYDIKDKNVMCKRMELDFLFLLGVPGPKMIWQFGELGYDISIDSSGRIGKKPIKWNYQSEPSRASIYNMVRTLNGLRQNEAIFSTSNISISAAGKVKQITLVSESGDETAIILGNFDVTEQTKTIVLPVTGIWYEYFGNTSESISDVNYSVTLKPGEYRIYSNKKINQPIYVGISKHPLQKGISLYPNPCANELNINTLKSIKSIGVYDISGRTMKFLNGNNSGVLKLSGIKSGLYSVNVTTTDGQVYKQNIVKR